MYTMKQACEKTGLSYETLKFYCNQGLVPNVKRDSQNRRIFDDRDRGMTGITVIYTEAPVPPQRTPVLFICVFGSWKASCRCAF